MSNRCGHDRTRLRLCDVVKRGKGGAPQVLGIISGHLNDAATNPRRLKAWHRLNPSGRGRRSEAREAMIATLQFLIANWFQLETRRCAMPGLDYLEVPDVKHMALKVSQSPQWKGTGRMSVGRVQTVLGDLIKAGYITRSNQIRQQRPTGEWVAFPKITTFTKKFFIELGFERLWRTVTRAGADKIKAICKRLDEVGFRQFWHIDRRLDHYLNPGPVYSPRQAWVARRDRPPDLPVSRPHLKKKSR